MSENDKQMGENLKRYGKLRGKMREKGIKGYYLARKMGTTPQSISHRMTGKATWRMDEMYNILSILGEPDSKLSEYFPRDGVDVDMPEEQNMGLDKRAFMLRMAELLEAL